MSDHSRFAPSAAPIWAHCSGAVRAMAEHPGVESEASRRGTAAHWVMAQVLETLRDGKDGPVVAADCIGQTAPNGVVIDRETVEGVQVLITDVCKVANEFGALRSLVVEHRVAAPHVHPENWGTLDAAIIIRHSSGAPLKIFLWDYKNGHAQVKAFGNYQLVNYVEGLRHELGLNGVDDQHIDVSMRVVQPFSYRSGGPIDEWACKLSDLRGYANVLRTCADEASFNPTLTTGAHCRYCSARVRCDARRQADYNLIDLAQQPYQMEEMTAVDMATEYRVLTGGLAAAKSRLEALEDELSQRIANGEQGTGLTLQTTYGRKDWTLPAAQIIAIAQQVGVDVRKEAVLTPTQAIKEAPADIRPAFSQIVNQFSEQKATGTKLVEVADSIVARAFKPNYYTQE